MGELDRAKEPFVFNQFDLGSSYKQEQLVRAQREADETSAEHTRRLLEAGIVDHLVSHNDRWRAQNVSLPIIDIDSAAFGVVKRRPGIEIRGWWNNLEPGEVSNIRQDWRWIVGMTAERTHWFVGYDGAEPVHALTSEQVELLHELALDFEEPSSKYERGLLKRARVHKELKRFPVPPGAITDVPLASKQKMTPFETVEHYFGGTPEQKLATISATNDWLMSVFSHSRVYGDQLDRVMVLLVKARQYLRGISPREESAITETLGVFISRYRPVITSIASKRLHGAHRLELEDLIIQGQIGMMEALERFDLSEDNEVMTFATARTTGSMVDEIRDNGALIRIPRSVFKLKRRLETNDPTLVGKARTDAEREVAEMELMKPFSLDFASPEEEHLSLLDVLTDHLHEEQTERDEQTPNIDVDALLATLPRRNENIMRMYLGLLPYTDSYNLREIADQLGLTESRISQLFTRSCQHLEWVLSKDKT